MLEIFYSFEFETYLKWLFVLKKKDRSNPYWNSFPLWAHHSNLDYTNRENTVNWHPDYAVGKVEKYNFCSFEKSWTKICELDWTENYGFIFKSTSTKKSTKFTLRRTKLKFIDHNYLESKIKICDYNQPIDEKVAHGYWQ